jgi:hypothetical protein
VSAFNALWTALNSRLAGGTALTSMLAGGTASPSVYHLQAPKDSALDYVVFSHQGGGDENLTGNRTKNLLVFARGYSSTGPAKAGSIDAQIDVLLHMKPMTVSGWGNFWLAREEDFELVEFDSARVPTWMAGAMYRVRLDAS